MFQKFFSMFFAYIIGFQLVVGAIPHHALNSSAWAQNSCSSGLQWNDMLGRCVTTAQAAELKDASKMCEASGDEVAKKQCYRDVIDGKMRDEGVAGAGKISASTMSIALALISLFGSVYFLATGGPADCPGATSAYLIAGSALAVVAGEIMSASKYKSAVKKAEDKFKKVTSSTNKDSQSTSDNATATSAQAEAFQAMIEMEEATISAAKTKNMLYMVATAGYAAATVLSTIETIRYMSPVTAGTDQLILTCKNAMLASHQSSNPIKSEDTNYLVTTQSGDMVQNFTSGLTLAYIDNYFARGQRVSYGTYFQTSTFEVVKDMTQLAFVNQEMMSLKSGKSQGPSTQEYEHVLNLAPASVTNVSVSDFNLFKLATVVAQNFTVPSALALFQMPLAFYELPKFIVTATRVPAPAIQAGGFTIKKLFLTPMTRAVLAGIMTVNNLIMIKKTNDEKKKAEERKEFIERLKAQVEAAGTAFGCANNDRNDLSKPNCYCYSTAGGLNPARVNSATCKSLFGSRPALAGKTSNPTAVSNQKNCVARNGALDASCSCRTTNTCVSVSTPRVIGNVPTGNVLGNLPQTLNGLNNGSLSAADINGAQFGALAARLNNMNDKLINDPKNKALALQAKNAKASGEKIMKDMERSISSAPALAAAPSISSGLLNASTPTAALEEMKKELSQQIKGYEGNSVPVSSGTGGKKADDFSLDALSGNGGVTVTDEQLADAANSLDMSAAEINSDSNANIFSILSNRYQRSGMRRLFGGETVIEADKPTGTDINQ
jgi:hypothetical protein